MRLLTLCFRSLQAPEFRHESTVLLKALRTSPDSSRSMAKCSEDARRVPYLHGVDTICMQSRCDQGNSTVTPGTVQTRFSSSESAQKA